VVIGAIGIDAVAHAPRRKQDMVLAALPLLFAAHQLDEALIWLGLQGRVSWEVGRAATWVYVVIAYVLLPLLLPLLVVAIEPIKGRRFLLLPFVVVGAVVSTAFLIAVVRGPMSVNLAHLHLSYHVEFDTGRVIDGLYVVATCGSLLLSGYRHIRVFGVLNIVAVLLLAKLAADGYASLWCAWAAVTSAGIAAHVRFAGQGRRIRAELI
jgi:hypothetical protein